MNISSLVGRITKDLTLQALEGGHKIVRFSLAVDNGKDSNGEKRQATFVPITAWNRTAEVLSQYCGKGSLISIVGHIDTSNYEKDGRMVYNTFVVVDHMKMLETKNASEQPQQSKQQSEFEDVLNNDNLPF